MLHTSTRFRARTQQRAGGATLLACALLCPPAAAGKLARLGDAARSSSGASAHGTSPSCNGERGGGSSSGSAGVDVDGAAVGALLYAVASPWLVPYSAVEERRLPGAAGRVRFAPYPYADGAPGSLLEGRPAQALLDRDDVVDAGAPIVAAPGDAGQPSSRKSVALELGAEAAIGVDEDVVRSGLHVRAQFPYRLGLDTSWSWYRELNGSRDQLGMGREHLNLRFAESSHVEFWTGIGPQHLADSRGWVHGIDVTWAFQAFPVNPLVIAAEGSLGNLGTAFAPGVRGELGFMLNRFEVAMGYEQRWVGGIGLGGPFVSLTAWL